MQIRPKKTELAILFLINLAEYSKEMDRTDRFFIITFNQSCVILFLKIVLISWVFEIFSISTISGWLGWWRKNFPTKLFDASGEDSLKEASCKISTKADNYFKSYAIL